jgi:hypothetical protein
MSPVERQDAIDAKLTQAAAICALLAEKLDGNFSASNSAWAAKDLILDARSLALAGEPA